MVKLLPHSLILCLLGIILVKGDNVDDRLRILFLFFLSDTAVIEHSLPFFGKALCNQISFVAKYDRDVLTINFPVSLS
jgi:hypothetical protein